MCVTGTKSSQTEQWILTKFKNKLAKNWNTKKPTQKKDKKDKVKVRCESKIRPAFDIKKIIPSSDRLINGVLRIKLRSDNKINHKRFHAIESFSFYLSPSFSLLEKVWKIYQAWTFPTKVTQDAHSPNLHTHTVSLIFQSFSCRPVASFWAKVDQACDWWSACSERVVLRLHLRQKTSD